MNISIWYFTYQHYDEIINQSLNTCIILVGGRSDLLNSGGRWSEGGERIFSKFKGSWLKGGSLKIHWGFGPLMKLWIYKIIHYNTMLNTMLN